MSIRDVIQKNAIVAVVAMVAGFFGSILHGWIGPDAKSIRAKRFEVVGASGRILSYWGPDSDPQIPDTTPRGILLVFMDTNGVRRSQIGSRAGDYAPELLFYGKEGPSENKPPEYLHQPRFSLTLGYNEDPMLAMRDRSTWRVLLGAEHGDAPSVKEDDWRISFKSRTNAGSYMGTHGVNSARSQAFVTVRDDKGKEWAMPPDFQYEIEGVPILRRPRP